MSGAFWKIPQASVTGESDCWRCPHCGDWFGARQPTIEVRTQADELPLTDFLCDHQVPRLSDREALPHPPREPVPLQPASVIIVLMERPNGYCNTRSYCAN